jgi:hypothetical protein
MRTLRLGSNGPDVERWKAFLRGRRANSQVVVDGVFDQMTDQETKVFQTSKRLVADGVVGNATYAAAMKDGFVLVEDDFVDQNGPNWPPKPNFKPLSPVERESIFGKFAFVPAPTKNNPEAIRITDGWASKNITSVSIPQLDGISGAPRGGTIPLHTLLVSQTIKMFKVWEEAGLMPRVLTWAGTWVPRFSRGSRTYLSNHSWGTAFDINVAWNGLGVRPALVGQTGSVRELVEIATEHGFYWGGWFNNRPDGMHFEAYKVL